jgi:hypothetical protein
MDTHFDFIGFTGAEFRKLDRGAFRTDKRADMAAGRPHPTGVGKFPSALYFAARQHQRSFLTSASVAAG